VGAQVIGVIINPQAMGVRRRRGLRDRLQALAGRWAEVVETRTPADLRAAIERFRGLPVIATCGGDGTNLSTITEVVRACEGKPLPTIAILRGGTVNTIAENLGIHGEPDAIFERLVGWVARGEEVPSRGQDLLQVNGLYGFLFASLMGARFLEAYYGGLRPGPAWAGLLAARTVASSLVKGPFSRWLFSPVELTLTVDGERPRDITRPRLLLASTVPDVGIGMKVTWQAGRQPGRFHLIATELSTTKMALQLHKVLGGRPLSGGPHLDVLAKSATIEFAQPQTYTLDGDLFRETRVDIAVGPRLWIARP
jgi:diacylglycerol kinase family enzyme